MCDWSGQRLGEHVALVVFAFPVDDPDRGTPAPLLATASGGPHRAVVHADQFGQFLSVHRQSRLVCHGAARLHWILLEHLVRASDTAAVEALWEFSRAGRLVDVELLDDLVGTATGTEHSLERTMESLARRHCQVEICSREDVESRLFRAAQDGRDGLDPGLREEAIALADATLAVFRVLWPEASRIAREHCIEEGTIEQFGPLSIAIQVQGAIALHRAAQLGFRLDEEAVERAILTLESERERYAQDLMRDREARQCFRSDQKGMRFRGGLPDVNENRLRAWLNGLLQTFLGPYEMPVRVRIVADDNEVSAVPEKWGSMRMANRSLLSWSRLMTVSKNLRSLRRNQGGAVRPQYQLLERIGSDRPDQDSLHDLLNRGVLLDDEGRTLIVVRFPDLDTRALAAVCRSRYGQSSLAEVFEQGIDVYQHVAEVLANSDLGDIGTISGGAAQRLESWKRVGRAHFLAIALKLGHELASKITRHGYDVPLNAAASARITEHICEMFPELGEYARDDTIDVLARRLNAETEVHAWWERNLRRPPSLAEVSPSWEARQGNGGSQRRS